MRRLSLALVAASVIAAGAPAIAQQQSPAPATAPQTEVSIPRGVFFRGQVDGQILSSDNLIGGKIYAPDGKIIADIEELILTSDLRVEGVVVKTGGFLGAGQKRLGLRFSALRFGPDGKITVPELTKEVIAALPAYERKTPRKTLLERAAENARSIADRSMETAKPAIDQASEAAKDAYEKAKEATKEAYDKAKESVQQPKQ
ncbi:PRC-barrel domain-containing protein [Hyphomicrobium sp. CS1BSMeth3]|jgi:hypothetical protein|uniref:PRC-barrel domain-containing protein n=1 Tax=Hyphomicrobium sp. CS1BSMeth3 TaxID=1892844 RepID=UPI0009315C35|nr:PRC-barrel domain-containing protein [Hyphomicrobium sp. CS1BSMeth3]